MVQDLDGIGVVLQTAVRLAVNERAPRREGISTQKPRPKFGCFKESPVTEWYGYRKRTDRET
jgi:hypothetical protein